VAVLAPMPSELKAVVRAGSLSRVPGNALCSHQGSVGGWSVSAGVIGMGPGPARRATERVLATGPFDHIVVVGIAGGLAPSLRVGALMVPELVRHYPDGPPYRSHPLGGRETAGTLMTTDGLFSDDEIWQPMADEGVGAVDMEAAGVAEVCQQHGVPWSVYRGISDRPDEHIVDQAVFALSKPDGSPDLGAVAKYLARDPRRAKALSHLNRCMQLAARVAAEAAFADLAAASSSSS
jgi:adenosylhomocysteine nucleosidase